ncbi:MAG TPA: zinc ribbon domain-containing protein, partial [Vicinamibacteria bacterium]
MIQCPNCGRAVPESADRLCPGCGAALPGSTSTAPAPPPFPGSSSPSGGTPWERRGEIGFLPALFETTKQVLLSPALFFRGMPVGPGLADPLLYAVILGYAGVIVQALYQAFFHVALGSLLPRGFGG